MRCNACNKSELTKEGHRASDIPHPQILAAFVAEAKSVAYALRQWAEKLQVAA